MAEILIPRPAATVLTLREGKNGYEILMLRRNLNSDFVGGAYVFPGGGVDPADASEVAQKLSVGMTDASCSQRLKIKSGGLAYYVACLRELFEEGGILIACDDQGREVDITDRTLVDRLNRDRASVNDGSLRFVELLEREGLYLDLRNIGYLAHWVTPVGPPRRYDTRFFVALSPVGQVAGHDEYETVASRWIRPVDALAMHARGELEMIFPTIRNLEIVAQFDTAQEVLDYANALVDIPRTEPRVVERDGAIVILVPGDDGYEVEA
ncbi:MAG: NUDIX hydrolase [Acidimicrobiales bacterium]|jgi:8-oxo-dGTP pyrophosphatase MutT (NUDIX family)